MHVSEPEMAKVAARRSLTSMSQRTNPGNHVGRLSVGQMIALTKLHKLKMLVQMMRLQAATFRFRMCQTRGGMSRTMISSAKVGRAIDAGVRLSAEGAIERYADR